MWIICPLNSQFIEKVDLFYTFTTEWETCENDCTKRNIFVTNVTFTLVDNTERTILHPILSRVMVLWYRYLTLLKDHSGYVLLFSPRKLIGYLKFPFCVTRIICRGWEGKGFNSRNYDFVPNTVAFLCVIGQIGFESYALVVWCSWQCISGH